MDFITTWNYQIKDRKVLPFLESLIGTEVRFRDKAIDRRKKYDYHSPAHTISRMLSKAAGRESVFDDTPLLAGVLDKDEWRKNGFDRFLTFRILYPYERYDPYNTRHNREFVTCAYITLHIEPCEVDPLREGGVDEGSRITGYEITAPKGGIIIDKNTTIHDLMSVNVNSYYKWLYRQIIAEYDTKVRSTITDDEEKSDELLRDMRFLCEELETDIVIAKKITSLT